MSGDAPQLSVTGTGSSWRGFHPIPMLTVTYALPQGQEVTAWALHPMIIAGLLAENHIKLLFSVKNTVQDLVSLDKKTTISSVWGFASGVWLSRFQTQNNLLMGAV